MISPALNAGAMHGLSPAISDKARRHRAPSIAARVAAFHDSLALVTAIFLPAAVPAWLMCTDRGR